MKPANSMAEKDINIQLKKPEMIVQKLSNGIDLLLKRDTQLPTVYTKLLVTGGLLSESHEENGIGNISMDLFGKGSRQLSKIEFRNEFDRRGAQIGAFLGKHSSCFHFEALSDYSNDLFPYFFEGIFDPKFDSHDLTDSVTRTTQAILTRQDHWQQQSMLLFRQHFFNEHPYSRSILGEIKNLNEISLSAIQSYYKKLTTHGRIGISVFGDINIDKVMTDFEHYTDGIHSTGLSYDLVGLPAKTKSTNINISIKQDVVAQYISFATLGMYHEDYLALEIIKTVLSGAYYPTGRIFDELRKNGCIYYFSGSQFCGLETGYLLFLALTNNKSLQKTEQIILDNIEKIKSTNLTNDELQRAIEQWKYAYLANDLDMDTASLTLLVDQLLNDDYSYQSKLLKNCEMLTPQIIRKTAEKYLVFPQIYTFKSTAA